MEESFDNYLDDQIRQHSGWQQLEDFGARLGEQALSERGRRVFLASTACFFREIPAGIVALALRVTDDQMAGSRFGAVDHGAKILLAAVDEYGLADSSHGFGLTHHKLFANMIAAFGVTEAELDNPDYIIPEAHTLAKITRELYRSGSVAAGVGFHFASEKTSDREFQLCFDSLAPFADVYAADKTHADPQDLLNFYYIHTVVEPMHGAASAEAVKQYAAEKHNHEQLLNGADQFMDAYGAFWDSLHKEINH